MEHKIIHKAKLEKFKTLSVLKENIFKLNCADAWMKMYLKRKAVTKNITCKEREIIILFQNFFREVQKKWKWKKSENLFYESWNQIQWLNVISPIFFPVQSPVSMQNVVYITQNKKRKKKHIKMNVFSHKMIIRF